MPIDYCGDSEFLSLLAMLEELRFFLVILEEGSLRRAAKRLHISQPALTRQMQLLEHDLGGRILERTRLVCIPLTWGTLLQRRLGAPRLLRFYNGRSSKDGSRRKRTIARWLLVSQDRNILVLHPSHCVGRIRKLKPSCLI